MRFPLTSPAWGILALLSLSPLVVAQGTSTGTSPAPAPTTSPSSAEQAMEDNGAGLFARALGAAVDGSLNEGGAGTHFAVSDDNFDSSEANRFFAALKARQESQESQYLYQGSQNVADAAALRGFTGKIVETRNTDANLGGRGQSVLSTGEREALAQGGSSCNGTSPISLFSGLGNTVTILTEDIPFDGGVIHITDGFFTLPGTLTDSLNSIDSTTTVASQIGAGHSLESTPQLTVFAPSNEALGDGTDFVSLTGAHVIVGLVAYSPLLVDGAVFQTQAGTDLYITSNLDGTILVNDATIIQNDIVIENGVVHVIDKVLSSAQTQDPQTPSSTGTAPPVFTGAAGWSVLSNAQDIWVKVVAWSIFVSVAIAAGGSFLIIT
ncbi:hypothetical protein FQN54_003751 [Arachnomyces sp. PD_36]|nr:hypothetical protein FQN54_003751 [Arachnomyces sp. PD_36]